MSTSYRFDESIPKGVFLVAVENAGLKVHTPKEGNADKDALCITDGEVYLWFYVHGGEVSECCRYGGNYDAVENILDPLSEELNTSYLSEYDDGYFDDEDEDPMGSGDEPKVWP